MTAYEGHVFQRFCRNAWLRLAGHEEEPVSERGPGLASLLKSEWSMEFEGLVRNRLVMGGLRYGFLKTAPRRRVAGLAVRMAVERLSRFLRDRNGEALADAAALCVVAFASGDWDWRPVDRTT